MIAVKPPEEPMVLEKPKSVSEIVILLITTIVIVGMVAYAGFLWQRLSDPNYWEGPVPPTEFIGR